MIVSAHPEARLLALTTYDGDVDIYRALDAGACGYLIKDMMGRELVQAIRLAASGKRVIPPAVASRLAEFTPRVDLTDREVEVLHFAKGLRAPRQKRVIVGVERLNARDVLSDLTRPSGRLLRSVQASSWQRSARLLRLRDKDGCELP